MFRLKSPKNRFLVAKRRTNRRVFEQLESRLLLADTPIDDSTMYALLAGLDGISGFGDRVSAYGQFAEPIRPFTNTDRSILTPGGIAPIGRTIDDDIGNPVRDFFNNQPIVDRTSNALVVQLGSEPLIVSIEGGLEDLAIDEIRFEIHLRKEFDLGLVKFEFGSPGHALGIGVENSVNTNLHVFLDVQFTLGVYLDPNLNFEQAVFVRGLSFNLSLEASAVFDPFTIGIGVLQASVPDVILDASLLLQVSDLAPNPLREWLLTDINTLSVDLLTVTLTDTNHINAQFDVTASVGDWVVSGSPFLQLAGDIIGFEPTLTFNADFSEMLLFNRITLDDIVSAQEQLGAWFSSLMNSDLFDVEIPFSQSASIGSVFDVGSAYGSFTRSLRDENGAPAFASAQAFPYTGNNGIDYDPVTNQLSYFILRNLPSQRTDSRASKLFVDQVLGLESDETAQIDADGNVRLRYILDLTQESQPLVDRTRFSDMRIDGEITPSLSGAAGDAAYGGLGITYSDATLSGQYTYRADIGDATSNADPFSLNELYVRLSDPTTLLESAIAFDGATQLSLTGLTVRDGLFALAADASIVATVSDVLTGIADVVVQNSADLASFENITFESLSESLGDAILGTANWASMGDEAFATVGHNVEDFVSVRQQRIVTAIQNSVDSLHQTANTTRLIVQDLPAFLENLSVATATGFLQFNSDIIYRVQSATLDLFFDAHSSVNQSMNFGLGFESLESYTSDSLIEGTDDFVGARASANAESSATLSIGLELDTSDPQDPVAYISESTRLTTNLYVGAAGLAMDGAVGSVGTQFTNGSLVIAQNILTPNPAAPAQLVVRVPNGNGRVRLSSFSGFQPTLSSVGRLRADFAVIPDSTGSATPERFTFRVGDLGVPLSSTVLISSPSFPDLRNAIDLPNQLQAVPPALDELFANIELQLEKQVFGNDFPLIGKALNGPANFFADLRTKLSDAFNTVSAFDIASIESAIETALNNLLGGLGDHVNVEIVSPTEIAFTLAFAGAPINEMLPSVDTDIGLPALGFSLDSELSVVGSYAMSLTFVVSVLDGVYIDTTNEMIEVDLDVSMSGIASGRLGFIAVTATASPSPSCGEAFHAQFVVGLTEPSGDGKLKLNELVTGDFIDPSITGLSGCAGMVFAIEATATEWLPTILTDLTIDWSFDGTDLDGDVPEVTFGKVQLKVGGFLGNVLAPFLETIRPIIEPLMPVVDVLTSELPVIDEFGIHTSLLDLAEEFAQLLPPDDPYRETIHRIQLFVGIIEALDKLSDAVTDESGSSAIIDIGSLQFGGTNTPQFDARLIELAETVLGSAQIRSDTVEQFLDIGAAPKTGAALYTTPGEFRLPIYENPLNVFKWILGFGQAEIVTYKFPGIHLNIPLNLPIPIVPGILSAGLFGSIESNIQLFMGIDTYGASQFSKSKNGLDFLQGFYVSDTDNADGTGRDVPELPITGTALLGVMLGETKAGLGAIVGGGITAKINVDLIDPDGDGKLRGFELSSPKGCLAIHGGVAVTVEASAVLGPLRIDFPLTSNVLGNFNAIVHCNFTDTPANLARLDSTTGELRLFVGDYANRRNIDPDVIDEEFTVTQNGAFVTVSAFGASESFSSASVVSIYADAGSGDDRIIIDASVSKAVILIGGDGDDYLQGGSGRDTITGNDGDDRLLGGRAAI